MGGLSSADGTYTILDGATIGKSYNEAGLTSIYVTTPFTNNAVVYVSPEFGGVKFHAMYCTPMVCTMTLINGQKTLIHTAQV